MCKTNHLVREATVKRTIASAEEMGKYLLDLFSPFEQFEQEEVWVFLFNARVQLTYEVCLYRGTINAALVRPAEVFREAIRLSAYSIMVAHNHPSQDPSPSDEDWDIYHRLRKAGELLGIEVNDAFVVGKHSWVSMRAMSSTPV